MRKLFYIGPNPLAYNIHMIFYVADNSDFRNHNIVHQHCFPFTTIYLLDKVMEECKPKAKEFAREVAGECGFTHYTIDISIGLVTLIKSVTLKREEIFKP